MDTLMVDKNIEVRINVKIISEYHATNGNNGNNRGNSIETVLF